MQIKIGQILYLIHHPEKFWKFWSGWKSQNLVILGSGIWHETHWSSTTTYNHNWWMAIRVHHHDWWTLTSAHHNKQPWGHWHLLQQMATGVHNDQWMANSTINDSPACPHLHFCSLPCRLHLAYPILADTAGNSHPNTDASPKAKVNQTWTPA